MKLLLAILVSIIAVMLPLLSRHWIKKLIEAAPNKKVRQAFEQSLIDYRKRDAPARFMAVTAIGFILLLATILILARILSI